MPESESTANNRPSPFQEEIADLETAVSEGRDISGQAAYLLALVNHYPDSVREEDAPPLTESLREVILESVFGDIRKSANSETAAAFAREARRQLAMTLDEHTPGYAKWQFGVTRQNRGLMAEALHNAFPRRRPDQPEAVGDAYLDRDFGALLRGELPPARPEKSSLRPEDEFKRDINNAVDIVSLRQILEERSLELEGSIKDGGEYLAEVYMMRMHGPDRYKAWIKMLDDKRVPEELKSKLKRIFDTHVLVDMSGYARSDKPDQRQNAEQYYPFFSENWLAGRVRQLFEDEGSDDSDKVAFTTVLLEPGIEDEVYNGKKLAELTSAEFRDYLKARSREAEKRLSDRSERIIEVLRERNPHAIARTFHPAADAAVGPWRLVHRGKELMAPFDEAVDIVAKSDNSTADKSLVLDALAPRLFLAFRALATEAWKSDLPNGWIRKAKDGYRNSPLIAVTRLIEDLAKPNVYGGSISEETRELMMTAYNQVILRVALKSLDYPARTRYDQGSPIEKAMDIVDTFVYGKDPEFTRALKSKMISVLREEDVRISGSR